MIPSITPLGLVPLASILAGKRPFGTAFAFMAGLFVSYLIMVLLILLGVVLVVDGTAYFMGGPLVPIGFPGGSGSQSM